MLAPDLTLDGLRLLADRNTGPPLSYSPSALRASGNEYHSDYASYLQGTIMTEKQDGLSFLPLGGTGEIGMNFNLYCLTKNGHDTWLAIDCGIGFRATIRLKPKCSCRIRPLSPIVRGTCAVS